MTGISGMPRKRRNSAAVTQAIKALRLEAGTTELAAALVRARTRIMELEAEVLRLGADRCQACDERRRDNAAARMRSKQSGSAAPPAPDLSRSDRNEAKIGSLQ